MLGAWNEFRGGLKLVKAESDAVPDTQKGDPDGARPDILLTNRQCGSVGLAVRNDWQAGVQVVEGHGTKRGYLPVGVVYLHVSKMDKQRDQQLGDDETKHGDSATDLGVRRQNNQKGMMSQCKHTNTCHKPLCRLVLELSLPEPPSGMGTSELFSSYSSRTLGPWEKSKTLSSKGYSVPVGILVPSRQLLPNIQN
ncbi:hypothetical protein BS17DRAFT_807468 [Gyrodon lividus]|nr:hypothetical protein BS17DRAFT_807468 [Gyrodon lividus]